MPVRNLTALFFSLFLASPVALTAQAVKSDSLLNVIKTATCDTCVVDAYIELASVYRKQSSPDTAQEYANQGLVRAQKLNYRRGYAKACYQLGVLNALKGDPVEALRKLEVAEGILDSLRENRVLASVLQAISIQKVDLGDFSSALDYCNRSLKIKQGMGDSSIMSSAYSTLAHLYNSNDQFDKAIAAFSQSMRLDSLYGQKIALADDYYNIGNTYKNIERDSMSLYYLRKCLVLTTGSGEDLTRAYAFNAIGSLMLNFNLVDSALYYHRSAFELAERIGEPRLLSSVHLYLGEVYQRLGDNVKAEAELFRSVGYAEDIKSLDAMMNSYHALAVYYENLNRPTEALKYLKLYMERKDSLFNERKHDELTRKELNYAYEKQRELDKAEQDKQNVLYEEDRKIKKVIIYSVAGFAVLLVFFLANLYFRFRTSQRQKVLIAEQKAAVELQNLEIESKNKDITDSINYASRIQSAILPDVSEVRKYLKNSFVYYRPKDIVSGDFYWISETEQYVFYATADCTGHGVPGGFMSMLGMALLNEVVIERKILEPARIVDVMRERIISALKQKGISGENKDGMDMVLCRINRNQTELCFAAANNNLWLLRNGTIQEYKADKQPVGIGPTETKPFTQHSIALESGDTIYTFTDGYADQFGGLNNKKYKYSQMKKYLISCSQDTMQEQGEKLNREFITWKGISEQVDDVLVIGVRIA